MATIQSKSGKDVRIIIQQQGSKRQRSVPQQQDPPSACSHHQSNYSPLSTRAGQEEQHHPDEVPNEEKHRKEKNSPQMSSLFSKKEHGRRIPPDSANYTSSSSSSSSQLRQTSACKRHWMFTRTDTTHSSAPTTSQEVLRVENKSDENKDNEEYNRQSDDLIAPPSPSCSLDSLFHQHNDRLLLRRRKAAIPGQLLKWAFDASMSLYDHLSDDDDDDDKDYHCCYLDVGNGEDEWLMKGRWTKPQRPRR